MIGETVSKTRVPQGTESKPRPQRPGAAALIQNLEKLRETVHQRLAQIEELTRERPAQSDPVDPERERELQRRFAELEDAQRRLRAETERWERERQAAVEQLEHDRRLLAESWERLEREQVENHSITRQTPADRMQPVVVRSSVPEDRDDPVAQAILRQFQVLRRDVRRNSNGHRHS